MSYCNKRVKDDMLTKPNLGPAVKGRLLHSLPPVSGKGARIDREVARKNREAGFAALWHVWERYVIRRSILLEEGKIAKTYAPAADCSLPTWLARVHGDKKYSLEKFSTSFGLLGYCHLAPLEHREGGDPVEWFTAHAHTVSVVLDLIGLLEESERADSPEAAQRAHRQLTNCLKELPTGPYAFAHRVAPSSFVATVHWPANPIGAAHDVLRHLLNPNIQGVRRKLYQGAQGRSRSFFSFQAMIEAVYWQLVYRLEQGGIRRCEECGRFFVARDRRLRYCPAPTGTLRSRCASRFHVRKLRKDREDERHEFEAKTRRRRRKERKR